MTVFILYEISEWPSNSASESVFGVFSTEEKAEATKNAEEAKLDRFGYARPEWIDYDTKDEFTKYSYRIEEREVK